MYAQKLETLPPPPGVIGSLKAGFEAVSSHVILISIPFLVDVFLWLGPRLGVSKVLGPVYDIFFNISTLSAWPHGCRPSLWGFPA